MNAIKYIRTQVFGMTQSAFEAATGIPQSTVSRWERGVCPDLDGMRKIRDAAERRGLVWNDAWFFKVPQPEQAQ